MHYLGAEKIIQIANEVFGFNGWSTSIRDTTIDYVDIDKDGRVSMGLSVIMRVTLRDGTYHEDVGYGMISNCSGKGAAFEKTKKEAATDAMKRALRNFGNVLGNCLYDKDYLKKVVKIKPPPSKWSEENLYRHQDVVPRKQEPKIETPAERDMTSIPPTRNMSAQSRTSGTTDYDDEFGGNAFDDVDFTRSDEFVVPDTSGFEGDESYTLPRPEVQPIQKQAMQRSHSVPQQRPPPQVAQRPPVPPQARPPMQQRPTAAQNTAIAQAQAGQNMQSAGPQQNANGVHCQRPQGSSGQQRANSSTPEVVQQRQGMNGAPNGAMANGQPMPETPVGFVRGRLADMIQAGTNGQMPANAAFNPHAESPSIRKTNGVNHRTSAPIRREDIGAPAAPAPEPITGGPGFVAPQRNETAQVEQRPPMQMAPPRMNGNMTAGQRTNFVNPQQDPHRRIGAPMQGGMQSPGPRPGGYRPPGPAVGQKRGPPDANAAVPPRPPLSDVSNNVKSAAPVDAGNEMKRMRMHGQGPGPGQEQHAVTS